MRATRTEPVAVEGGYLQRATVDGARPLWLHDCGTAEVGERYTPPRGCKGCRAPNDPSDWKPLYVIGPLPA